MADDGDRNYEVGYGKPPEYSRFRKGQSGNPKAIQLLLGEVRLVEGREPDSTQRVLFDEADREVIRHLYERFRAAPQQKGK